MPTATTQQRDSNVATPRSSTWQLQEAKNKFSEVVRRAKKGPQIITVHGEPTVMVISYGEFKEVVQPKKKSFLEMMATCPVDLTELDFERDKDTTMRPVDFL
ncbi:MAG: type II toxin-antitoxin system Phd/YefM family antitoxin [Coriobacteriia bacterium]|nr:type II toxin-antitoxin system Phd/YefM family antitoxin [Coriobacteriia bacterium]